MDRIGPHVRKKRFSPTPFKIPCHNKVPFHKPWQAICAGLSTCSGPTLPQSLELHRSDGQSGIPPAPEQAFQPHKPTLQQAACAAPSTVHKHKLCPISDQLTKSWSPCNPSHQDPTASTASKSLLPFCHSQIQKLSLHKQVPTILQIIIFLHRIPLSSQADFLSPLSRVGKLLLYHAP